jgi:uncharacterized repeat protein (TIGR03803 family)
MHRNSVFLVAAMNSLVILAGCVAHGFNTIPAQAPLGASGASSAPAYHVLYRFRPERDVTAPTGLVATKSGLLYGTAASGGGGCDISCGGVFRLTPSTAGYRESVIYAFKGEPDGEFPTSGVVMGKGGTLYGTTESGGAHNWGTVFELSPSHGRYIERILHSFKAGRGGSNPYSQLIMDGSGALYGTTQFGGHCSRYDRGCGVVFKLTPNGTAYTESVLHAFTGGDDGAIPRAGLVIDSEGSLYGTTDEGGGSPSCSGGYTGSGCGAVFKLTPSGSHYSEKVILRFGVGSVSGRLPSNAPLALGDGGVLYGATKTGSPSVHGTIFKLTPSGSHYAYSLVDDFATNKTGAEPIGVTIDGNGAIYGITNGGGRSRCSGVDGGCGVLFKLTPSGSTYVETVLHYFGQTPKDGTNPSAPVIFAGGSLYGTASAGGFSESGAVYRLTLDP